MPILNKGSGSKFKVAGAPARRLDKAKNSKRNSPYLSDLASALSLCAGPALYRRLKEYLMTEEQLKENGYPMPHPEKPGRAVLFTAEEKKTIDCKLCWLFHSARFARYITTGDACPALQVVFLHKGVLGLSVEPFAFVVMGLLGCDRCLCGPAGRRGEECGCRSLLPF